MGMEDRPRVAIMPQGSRGDCQPFIGLAITLCKQGAVVKVFASKTHLSLAKPFLVDADGAESKGQGSLDFVSSENFDYDALYKHPLMMKSLQTGDLRLFQKAFEDQADALVKDAHETYLSIKEFKPDVLVYNSTSYFNGVSFSEALGTAGILVSMQMIGMSAVETPFAVPPDAGRKMPGWLKKYFFKMIMKGAYNTAGMKLFQQEIRVNLLGQSKLSFEDFMNNMHGIGSHPGCPKRVLIARSPLLSPPPKDWPTLMKQGVIGDFIIDSEDQMKAWPPNPDLLSFLEGCDKPPVYIGWGSMSLGENNARLSEMAVRAAFASGRRGILLAGWARLALSALPADLPKEIQEYAQKDVLIVPNVAHEWLFKQCSICVHHGGAGTTGAALRAGVPSIITPFFADQPELADKVSRLGVGVGLKHVSKLGMHELGQAVVSTLASVKINEAAKTLAKRIHEEENGAQNAAKIVFELCAASSVK